MIFLKFNEFAPNSFSSIMLYAENESYKSIQMIG